MMILNRLRMFALFLNSETMSIGRYIFSSLFALIFVGSKICLAQSISPTDTSKCIQMLDTASGIKFVKHAEKSPGFKGGEEALFKYIQKHFNYDHSELKRMNILPYLCIIGPDGSVLSARILFNPGVSDEMIAKGIRFIKKLPKFEPGTCGGQPIAVEISMPIMVKP